MCNEREDAVWIIHGKTNNENAVDGPKSDKTGHISVAGTITGGTTDSYVTLSKIADSGVCYNSITVDSMYTKNDHATSGVNRKFDATLVDTVDEVFRRYWDLPEYLPFRECVKMGIQDGIEAGMKRASAKYDDVVSKKNAQIIELENERNRWKNAFRGLLLKCREGIDAIDFIAKVVHCSCGK